MARHPRRPISRRPGRPVADRRLVTGLVGRRRPGGPHRPRFIDWTEKAPERGCWHRRLPAPDGRVLVQVARPPLDPAATAAGAPLLPVPAARRWS